MFSPHQVIKGWDEGVMQMTKGEKAVITCPPEYVFMLLAHAGS
jgi:FKBP-type peptidyl-prolyl cis-trans isomerase